MKVLIFVTWLFLISIMYGMISFYNLTFDFTLWGEGARFLLVAYSFGVTIISIGIVGGIIMDENESNE